MVSPSELQAWVGLKLGSRLRQYVADFHDPALIATLNRCHCQSTHLPAPRRAIFHLQRALSCLPLTFAASSALATTSGIPIYAVPRTVATKHVGRFAPSGFRSDAAASIVFVPALQRFTLDPSLNIHNGGGSTGDKCGIIWHPGTRARAPTAHRGWSADWPGQVAGSFG